MINRIDDAAMRIRVAGQLCKAFANAHGKAFPYEMNIEMYAESRESDDLPIIVADWNDARYKVLGGALEAIGATCGWSDSDSYCSGCQAHVETEPTWFGWEPKWIVHDGGYLCLDCARGSFSVRSEAGKPLTIDADGNAYRGGITVIEQPYESDEIDEWFATKTEAFVDILRGKEGAIEAFRSEYNAIRVPVTLAYIGDGYLYGASIDDGADDPAFWPPDIRGEMELVRATVPMSDIAAVLAQGTSDQVYADGYNVNADIRDQVTIWSPEEGSR